MIFVLKICGEAILLTATFCVCASLVWGFVETMRDAKGRKRGGFDD